MLCVTASDKAPIALCNPIVTAKGRCVYLCRRRSKTSTPCANAPRASAPKTGPDDILLLPHIAIRQTSVSNTTTADHHLHEGNEHLTCSGRSATTLTICITVAHLRVANTYSRDSIPMRLMLTDIIKQSNAVLSSPPLIWPQYCELCCSDFTRLPRIASTKESGTMF